MQSCRSWAKARPYSKRIRKARRHGPGRRGLTRPLHTAMTRFYMKKLSGGLRRSPAHRERLGIDVQADLAHLALPAQLEHAILRIAQEAIANAVKHAHAQVIRVRLSADGDHVVLIVSDDGAGFDPAAEPGTGLGLRAMWAGGRTRRRSAHRQRNGTGNYSTGCLLRRRGCRPRRCRMIRVLIADDHQVVRQGLVFQLTSEPGIEVAGEAADGLDQALE